MNDRRTFWICLPPRHAPRQEYPVAYFNNGDGYLHFADLPRVIEYLIKCGAAKPFITVLIEPNDREKGIRATISTSASWQMNSFPAWTTIAFSFQITRLTQRF